MTEGPPQQPHSPDRAPSGRGGTNGMAIAALVLGILAILFLFLFFPIGIVLAVLAIVLGLIGRGRANRDPGLGGKGMALAGVIMGVITLLLVLILGLIIGAVITGDDDEEGDAQDVEEVALAYGDSDGDEACEYMSSSVLDQLGGESGCAQQFEGVPPAEFDVQTAEIEGETATASVENVESEQVIELEFVNEEGEWKISSFPGLETIAPPADGQAPDEGGEATGPEEETTEEETTEE